MVKIRICPKCKSPNLEQEPTHGMEFISGAQPIYTCKKCNHSGPFFPEVSEKEFKKLHKKNADNNC